jgi:hypothetical protein
VLKSGNNWQPLACNAVTRFWIESPRYLQYKTFTNAIAKEMSVVFFDARDGIQESIGIRIRLLVRHKKREWRPVPRLAHP